MTDVIEYCYGPENEREQIARCQQPELGYIAAHTNATGRIKLGQVQVFCETCGRWKWTDGLCYLAKTRPYMQTSATGEEF